jgi:glycosyltransferase involved in cell wall biosynthesis
MIENNTSEVFGFYHMGARLACVTSVPFFLVTQFRQQLIKLREYGIAVTAVTSPGPELAQIPWSNGLKHVAIDIRRKPAPWHDIVALVRMAILFYRYGFNIVHSTTPKAGLLTAVAAWLARVPVRLHTFTGQQWVTMSGPLRFISRWSDRVICMLNTRVYADSPSQRQYLINEGIVCGDRIGIIGAGSLAGVDVCRFNQDRISKAQRDKLRQQLGISHNGMIITFIGRITRDKGINELLQAVHALLSEGRLLDLVLIGPMDSALDAGRGQHSGTISELLLCHENIHQIGYTNVPEQYLAITDILCLPSYREGFGTVVIEAAAMGIPTIGTRITGLIDAVVDEVTGLLVPAKDVDALIVALRRLIVDPVLRRHLGEVARQRCLEKFDSELVNRNLAEEYVRHLTRMRQDSLHDCR